MRLSYVSIPSPGRTRRGRQPRGLSLPPLSWLRLLELEHGKELRDLLVTIFVAHALEEPVTWRLAYRL